MKKFIHFTLLYFFVGIALVVIFDVATSALINSKANFVLPGKPTHIVVGHSHPECAFNDSLINNFRNLGESGEAYFYTYFKTKKVLEQNPEIKTVFIDFSSNQLVDKANLNIWSEKYLMHRYVKLSPIMGLTEKKILLKNSFRAFLNSSSIIGQNRLVDIVTNDYNYSTRIGGYKQLTVSKVDSILQNTPFSEEKSKTCRLSTTNIDYLIKLIQLCKKNNKQVLLIRCPVHKNYLLKQNDLVLKHVKDSLFRDIKFIDFANYPLSNNDFADLGHLNYRGAHKFSTWFNTNIRKIISD
ncbi:MULTISPECIES: hypothetical protein [unclassified Carboxylicivirga]|uniref:hypothetical protein n=1 Tax=Carboxylicivirga TaxID=1628153 RepID=UPI003D34F7BC